MKPWLRDNATLAYDRLGSGHSDHPDPVQVVQLPLQIEILHVLVQKLRNAEIGGYSFKNVVGVGHSLGSAVTQGVAARYPTDFDALISQGTSTNFNYAFTGVASEDQQIANTQSLPRFKNLADGYHTPADNQFALQFAFYRYPGYDPKSEHLSYLPPPSPLLLSPTADTPKPAPVFALQASNKQSNAIGETFTLGPAYAPATSFTGPVDIVNGQNDYFYCGGDCSYPTNQAVAALAAYFPSASKQGSQTFLAPLCGHNVNSHYSARKAFEQMLAFLKTNGIV
jgi:pimeloyl-ACP methyl ester carboxylesterase